ncbi:MAG: CsgG/HfaB family protein, partial [Candidatus Neomarinimicrobiota bacterium]
MPAQAIPIAVLDFEANGISQTEVIALTDRLRNELFRLGEFEVVERGLMEDILREQDFQMSGCTTNECLVEVGRLRGARQVIGGRISKIGAMFTVSARVVDVETGKVLGVSDYDLRGGLEEILTVGMKQVAAMLSGREVPMVPVRSSANIGQSSQPASGTQDDERPRTWSINVGLGSSRNANLLEITKDLLVGS